MNPLVTIFIAVYNAEQYLQECLDSVVNQTYKKLEILIINDGSSDKSIEIINTYKDNRIRLLNNTNNEGLPYTRNRGLKEAKGKYFATLDSDDISFLTRIQKQVDFMESNMKVDVVSTDFQIFTEKTYKNIEIRQSLEETKIRLIFGCNICNSSTMIRMSSVRKYGISYNLNCFVAQDYDLWVQFSKYGNIANIPEILLKYRTGHENITNKSNKTKQLERIKVISNIHNDILKYYGFDLSEKELILFNKFFGESINEYLKGAELINELKDLINKLSLLNNKKNIFTEKVFLNVLEDIIKGVIFSMPSSFLFKINIYNIMINNKNFIEITKIIKNHVQYMLKNEICAIKNNI